jgi:hypothetical protein
MPPKSLFECSLLGAENVFKSSGKVLDLEKRKWTSAMEVRSGLERVEGRLGMNEEL